MGWEGTDDREKLGYTSRTGTLRFSTPIGWAPSGCYLNGSGDESPDGISRLPVGRTPKLGAG